MSPLAYLTLFFYNARQEKRQSHCNLNSNDKFISWWMKFWGFHLHKAVSAFLSMTQLSHHHFLNSSLELLAIIALSGVQSYVQTFIHNAIWFLDTSNNTRYIQAHWLMRTQYLLIIPSNDLKCDTNQAYYWGEFPAYITTPFEQASCFFKWQGI